MGSRAVPHLPRRRRQPHFGTLIAATALAAALPMRAFAGDPAVEPALGSSAGPVLVASTTQAARRTGAIALDGRIDDAAWQSAPVSLGFWQRSPDEGQPPHQDTEFRVLYDDAALYVGIVAHDAEPDKIRGLLTRRDQMSESDWLYVGIDSYHDRRTSYVFGVNAAGVQRDLIIVDDGAEDGSWDAVWSSATARDAGGWSAELRIPFSQVRFSAVEKQIWGLQLQRVVGRSKEETVWSPWPRDAAQVVSNYGTLGGLDGIRPPGRLEVLPYLLGGTQISEANLDDDPFRRQVGATGNVGVDARYGLGPSFTLGATVNPDFGQVEADPSQVNLSANETFFAEKRPFFLEGANLFKFRFATGDDEEAVETMFYSRRIGDAPHDTAEDEGDYLDEPGQTTIYGATKLTGKTQGGWSIGLLEAVTAEETAHIADASGERSRAIEPLTNYAVARVQKDINDGRTSIAGVVTAVHRAIGDTGLEWLHDRAYTGGLSLGHRFADDTWSAELSVYGSTVHGSPEALIETQTASQRYYQRPDATHVELDPTRTRLSGLGVLWALGKWQGGRFHYGTGGDLRTPGLETNDIGFQRGADLVEPWLFAQYQVNRAAGPILNWQINSSLWTSHSLEPLFRAAGGNLNGHATLTNYWGFGGGGNVNVGNLDDRALRGGPALRRDDSYRVFVNGNSDGRKRVSAAAFAAYWWQPDSDSHNLFANANLIIQARSNLDFGVGPNVYVGVDDNQYVDEAVDAMGTSHYLLARVRQAVAGLTLRTNYTFSPHLSLQVYAQPFVAAARYRHYKEVVDARATGHDDRFHEFTSDELSARDGVAEVDRDGDGSGDFTFELGDFNFREIRSNVVLRWEYLPGSALFLIWSHERSSDTDDGHFRLGSDLAELAEAPGEHVVLVKLNYWIGL